MTTSRPKKKSLHPSYKGHDLIPIHLSVSEAASFNYLQGGQFIDDETGLREYSHLEPVIKIPEIRNLFIEITDSVHGGKPMPQEVTEILKGLEETTDMNEHFQPIPSDSDPEIQKLASLADSPKDTVVVLMPSDIVNFLDILRGGPQTDPVAHIEEFGWFNEVIRAVATVGGAVLGGPVGAAAGNFVGKVATGASPKHNIIPAAKIGAAAWGLGKGAQMLGVSIPGMASAAAPAAASTAASTIASSSPGVLGNVLGSASSWLPSAAMIGGGMYFSHKAQKEKQKEVQKLEKERREESHRLRRKLGFDDPLKGYDTAKFHPNEVESVRGGEMFDPREGLNYAKGGHVETKGRPIVGKGKGQEDLIPDDRVHEGGWIWDASTTSDWGDGSTKAGQSELEKLEKFIAKKAGNLKKYQKLDHGGQPRKVPCALSDGERYTPPQIVTAAGGGSNKEGADKLRAMTKFLRRHKIAHGTELPPPAPDIISVFKRVG